MLFAINIVAFVVVIITGIIIIIACTGMSISLFVQRNARPKC